MHENEIRAVFVDAPPTLSPAQAGRLLGKTAQTVLDWIDERDLPAFKAGGQWVIRRDAIIDWLIEQNRPAAPNQ